MKRYVSGMDDAEYTIGAEYMSIRTTNGMANFTSRNLIARADNHIPIPAGMNIINTRKSGKNDKFQVGSTR
jgi:hypothetical protein